MSKRKNPKDFKKEGRPLFDGKPEKEVVQKLEEAWAMDCPDSEACAWADISLSALYAYQRANPKFLQRKERLKEKPFLKARSTIMKELDKAETAKWYLERKRKKEFAQKLEQEMSGSINLNQVLDEIETGN